MGNSQMIVVSNEKFISGISAVCLLLLLHRSKDSTLTRRTFASPRASIYHLSSVIAGRPGPVACNHTPSSNTFSPIACACSWHIYIIYMHMVCITVYHILSWYWTSTNMVNAYSIMLRTKFYIYMFHHDKIAKQLEALHSEPSCLHALDTYTHLASRCSRTSRHRHSQSSRNQG